MPSHDRFEQGAKGRPEGHAAGHGAEQPSQGAPASLVGEEPAHENEAERNDPARPQAGHEAPHGELPDRARSGCQGRQRREGGQGTRHDAPDAEAVRQQSVDQRRRAVRDQVGGNDEPDALGRDAEPLRQLRQDRRDHERLEEDHECRRREHAEQALAVEDHVGVAQERLQQVELALGELDLFARAGELGVQLTGADAASVQTTSDSVSVTTTAGQRLTARVAIAADGRNSLLRDAAGKEIGKVDQSNPVPVAATKGTWAGFGDIVAMAAVEGILELIEKANSRPR